MGVTHDSHAFFTWQGDEEKAPALWEHPAGGEADEEVLMTTLHGPGDRGVEGDVWRLVDVAGNELAE